MADIKLFKKCVVHLNSGKFCLTCNTILEDIRTDIRNLALEYLKFKPKKERNVDYDLTQTAQSAFIWEVRTFELLNRIDEIEFEVTDANSPDICFQKNGKRYWVECINRDKSSSNQIARHKSTGTYNPDLDITKISVKLKESLKSKLEKINKYINNGVIHECDFVIIAINISDFDVNNEFFQDFSQIILQAVDEVKSSSEMSEKICEVLIGGIDNANFDNKYGFGLIITSKNNLLSKNIDHTYFGKITDDRIARIQKLPNID